LEAFQKAFDLKADGIELDVQMTMDKMVHPPFIRKKSLVSLIAAHKRKKKEKLVKTPVLIFRLVVIQQ
jgi:hypothetical protein